MFCESFQYIELGAGFQECCISLRIGLFCVYSKTLYICLNWDMFGLWDLLLVCCWFNLTLSGGGLWVNPPKVLVSGALQSDLRYPKFWHNSYMILRICFVKIKIHKFFQNFFDFFSVFWTPFTHKKIFLHFWAKNNLLLCTWRAACP